MSFAFVNKKFDKLNEREKEIQQYYDPLNPHSKQHPNIKDLRDDYKEDFKNYGFNRFQLKENQYDPEEMYKDVGDKRPQEDIELEEYNQNKTKGNQNIRRPQTAQNSSQKRLLPGAGFGFTNSQKSLKTNHYTNGQQNRPLTSTSTNQKSKQSQQRPMTGKTDIMSIVSPQGLTMPTFQNNNQRPMTANLPSTTVQRGDKYWINTKKYDKQEKSKMVRNSSALNKIIVDLDENQYQMAGDLNPIHQHIISQRFNDQKIYIDKTGQAHTFTRDLDIFQPRKSSPSDKDKNRNYEGFKESLKFVCEKKNPVLYQGFGNSKNKGLQKKQQQIQIQQKEEQEQEQQREKQNQQIQQQKNKKNSKPTNLLENNKFQTKEFNGFEEEEQEDNNNNINNFASNKKDYLKQQQEIIEKEQLEYKVHKSESDKVKQMKQIKHMVMSFNPGDEQVFLDNKNKFIPSLNEVDWNEMERDQTSNFSLIVMDLKTMNYINMEQISIENNKLVNTKLQNLAKYVNFKRIFEDLYLESDHTEDNLISKPFFYILIYQQNLQGQDVTLFEKFYFSGYLNLPLDTQIVDLLMSFYLRFLMIFDPSQDVSLKGILLNSLFIIQRKQVLPEPMKNIIARLKEKSFFLEDLSKKTKRYNIFPLMLLEFSQYNPQYQQYYNSSNNNNYKNSLNSVEEQQQLQQQQNQLQNTTRPGVQFQDSKQEIFGNENFSLYQQNNTNIQFSENNNNSTQNKVNNNKRPQTANLKNKRPQTAHNNLQKQQEKMAQIQQLQEIQQQSQEFNNNINSSSILDPDNNTQLQDQQNSFNNQLANQMVLRQQQQAQQSYQNQLQSLFEFKSKEDIINQFSMTTNFKGSMLSPLSSYQVISQKYGSTQYRPKSGKSASMFANGTLKKKWKSKNNFDLKQQMMLSDEYNTENLNVVNQKPDRFVHNSIKPPERKQFSVPNENNNNNNMMQDNSSHSNSNNNKKYNKQIKQKPQLGMMIQGNQYVSPPTQYEQENSQYQIQYQNEQQQYNTNNYNQQNLSQ